jgi:hypothetical protein
VITSDAWNVRNDYATCAFITSRFKAWRERRQVPAGGGYAITGDIEPFPHVRLDHRSRPAAMTSLSRNELLIAAFARSLEVTLEL